MRTNFSTAFIAALLTAPSAMALEPCKATPKIKAQTNLEEMSNIYFGDTSFEFAIMLATNARAFTKDFKFISDVNNLPKDKPGTPSRLCIPANDEATTLKNRFELYLDAVADMSLAEPSEVVTTLDPVGPSGPQKVVSWIRRDQAQSLAKSTPVGGDYTPSGAMWVTLDPHVQNFCQDYAANHSDELSAITLRLEQRLGLPPNASKTDFAFFQIDAPRNKSNLFRPCGDTEVTDTTCKLAPPTCKAETTALEAVQNALDQSTASDKSSLIAQLSGAAKSHTICHAEMDFFFQQYYSSYGQARPVEYPWTSLGYTFDWAPGRPLAGNLDGFVVVGESEYVVPAGTKITYLGQASTAQYCNAQQ